MFGIDPVELKKIKRDLTTIEISLIAILAHIRDTSKDDAIKGMCATSMKGLVRCSIENTQDIAGSEHDIAKTILDAMEENDRKKKEAKETPAAG